MDAPAKEQLLTRSVPFIVELAACWTAAFALAGESPQMSFGISLSSDDLQDLDTTGIVDGEAGEELIVSETSSLATALEFEAGMHSRGEDHCRTDRSRFDSTCRATANTNGDHTVNIADPARLVNFLFFGGAAPPEPFPLRGLSDLDDDIDLESLEPACT